MINAIQILVYLACLYNHNIIVNSFRFHRVQTDSYSTYNRKILTKISSSTNVIPDEIETIRNDIELYMSVRKSANATTLPPEFIEYIPGSNQPIPKVNNPLEFIQPSGWYKDKNKLDIESRSDKTTPLYAHPLSISELKKYGYESLSPIILNYGGPYKVGNMLNITWRDPIRKRKVIKVTVKQQQPGQLSLGSSFDSNLDETASLLNLEDIKSKTIENDDDDDDEWIEVDEYGNSINNINRPFGIEDQQFGMDYTDWNMNNNNINNVKISKRSNNGKSNNRIIEEDREKEKNKALYNDEKFRLQGFERVYASFVLLIGTFGYGRATQDLISQLQGGTSSTSISTSTINTNNLIINSLSHSITSSSLVDIVEGFKIAFPLLICFSIVCSLKSGQVAKTNNRDVPIWTIKAFLGGPQVLLKLLNLPPLPIKN